MNSNMQAVLILPISPEFKFSYSPPELDEFAEISEEFSQDTRKRLKNDFKVNLKMEEENLRNEAVIEEKEIVHGAEEDETVEEEVKKFSFPCTNPSAMSIWAEDVFENGYIRPMFPIFNVSTPLWPSLKKVFIQRPGISSSLSWPASESSELNGAPEGHLCKWSSKAVVEEASSKKCNKSNSKVFSELWKLRHKFHWSNRRISHLQGWVLH